MELYTIHESQINGQRKQMADQINEYGIYNFWSDYKDFLVLMYSHENRFKFYTDAVISYTRLGYN